ncbi:MAG: Kdo hydroxylase family protein [Isosphaeraceae bacterium]
MARITLREDRFTTEASPDEYRGLETGDILYFPTAPPLVSPEQRAFLVTQKQSDLPVHKNVSYRPLADRLRGIHQKDHAQLNLVHEIMRGFSTQAIAFMGSFLRRYATDWKIDFASFRPVEEEGRKVSLHSRNDLLHFDSFPTRPSHGDRLLRIFLNIHLDRPRVWVTSGPFQSLAGQFAGKVGLTRTPGMLEAWKRAAVTVAARLGLPVIDRPPYDAFMLKIHHTMKEDAAFQQNCVKDRWEFPAGSAWIVFTDSASHACLSGQYMLEQTFIVRRQSLTCPELAPISILEQIAGHPLARRSA